MFPIPQFNTAEYTARESPVVLFIATKGLLVRYRYGLDNGFIHETWLNTTL